VSRAFASGFDVELCAFGPSETMQVSPSDTLTVKVYLLENNPSVVDGMVGIRNMSSSNWFFLLRFSFGLIGVLQVCSHRRYASFLASGLQETHEGYQRHEGCTEVAMDSFEIRECQKTLMGLLELNTHAES